MAIRQAAGANALDTANNVKQKLEEMSRYFPAGMKVIYPYDTTPFTRVAIEEVAKTLFEAILLVFRDHVPFHGKYPGHPDSHHRRAGGAARNLCSPWVFSVFPSIC